MLELKNYIFATLSDTSVRDDITARIARRVQAELDNLRTVLRGGGAAAGAPVEALYRSKATMANLLLDSALAAADWEELTYRVLTDVEGAILQAATATVLRAVLDDYTAEVLAEAWAAMLAHAAAGDANRKDAEEGDDEPVFFD